MTQPNSVSESLPKMPEPRPTIVVGGVRYRLIHDFDRYANGSMLMLFADTMVKFERGNVKGSIGASVGGALFVQIGRRTWVLDDREAFIETLIAAENEQYLARSTREGAPADSRPMRAEFAVCGACGDLGDCEHSRMYRGEGTTDA